MRVTLRVGTGFDAHRLAAGRPLMLGGVLVPYARGLEGHSDGDCLVHALCDALLGAAGAGDMGRHFPSRDPRFEGLPSLRFLEEVARIVAARGYTVENVDATVVAEAPALAPHLGAMAASLARALGVGAGAVSVKAKSTDGLGTLGRGEGIAAQAVALLRKRRGFTTKTQRRGAATKRERSHGDTERTEKPRKRRHRGHADRARARAKGARRGAENVSDSMTR